MKRLSFLLLIVFFASAAVAEEPEKKPYTAIVDPDGVQRIVMSGGDFFFEPERIIVRVNVPVELSVRKKAGIAPHDIVMEHPEAGMDFKINLAKDQQIVKFTPTKTGTYEFFCSKKFLFFKSHRDRGMHGVIEVVEGPVKAPEEPAAP